MLKVAFVIRNDSLTKSGGDTDQAKQFSALISDPGSVETQVIRFAELCVVGFDLVVLFNIDMPFENYLVARECLRNKIPYVIYTLHPKAGHVEEFLRDGTMGAQHMAAGAAGYSLVKYETIACVVRLLKERRWAQLLQYRPALYSARYLLCNATQVLVSCEGEAEYIRRDFGVATGFDVLPHLVDESGLGNACGSAPRGMQGFILCAGRIEPRKNQMAVVEVAKVCREINFVFLGKKNRNHENYIRKFDEAVASHGNMEWRDQVPLAELQNMISTSRAYINLSWFEVFSLIDLMALSSETPSVLSTGSYLFDQVGSGGGATGVEFVGPNDVASAAKSLLSLPAKARIARETFMDDSWSKTAIQKKWADILALAIRKRSHGVQR